MKKMNDTLKEFKSFAMKGNVVDLALGVIIGGAFGKIVTSLVQDIITPLIGLLLGGLDISKLMVKLPTLWKAASDDKLAYLKYGNFFQSIIDFVIISGSIFFVIKLLSNFKKKEEAAPKPATPSKEEILLTEIRDLLKAKM